MEDTKNQISSFAQVSPLAEIGKGNIIKAGAIIYDNVVIGDNNYIGEYAVIGSPGECREGSPPEGFKTIIGSWNVIREHVTIQAPVRGCITSVGDDCYLMNKCHIGHDARIGNWVTIAPFVCIGGMVILEQRVNVGMSATIHPRITVQEGAMLGMQACITEDVKPWRTVVGLNRVIGLNRRGMEKAGWTETMIQIFIEQNNKPKIKGFFNKLFNKCAG